MKNRAKCKLCNSIIESFHPQDYVICKCGAIALDGGEAMRCFAKEWSNFIRIDDDGNEIIPKVIDNMQTPQQTTQKNIESKDNLSGPSKQELVEMLSEMVKTYQNMPQSAMIQPVTHYDLCSSLMLVLSIFKAED